MDDKKILKQISIDSIKPNPENPRLAFRQEEMDSLLVSIKNIGIQVPIVVYPEKDKFILIDGERRWRVCKKLNIDKIPAIVQSKPSDLDNLLLMFNIHALREQWDTFTIANKLTSIISLFEKKNKKKPNEAELSFETGLSRSTIRRCRLLIELPQRFKDILLTEIQKPKSKQKFTEDFFIEMEGSLKTVKNNFPELLANIDVIRDNLVFKFENGTIDNLTEFRKIGKIATAPKNINYSKKEASKALEKILLNSDTSIDQVYNRTVSYLYDEKKFISNINNLIVYIENLNESERKDKEVRDALNKIRLSIDVILSEEE